MNNKIEPCYVDFNQAKLLKEKGFDCNSDYNQWILAKDKGDDSKRFICHSDKLENYTYINEEEHFNVYHCLAIPEQWQVIEWLRINHDIWIEVSREYANSKYIYQYFIDTNNQEFGFNSPQEAYSTAFDYILTNLI